MQGPSKINDVVALLKEVSTLPVWESRTKSEAVLVGRKRAAERKKKVIKALTANLLRSMTSGR